MPIGVYTVLFELPGFQNVRREGVRLTVGFTARVDAEMNVGAVSETITVSGASPLVDTTSTATATELTREQLEVLPTSRDGFHAFLNQVPGVRTNLDVGSSGLGDTVMFRAYGQDGSPWQMLEGVLTSAPTATGAQGSHVDFNAIDGTRVQTVGSNAEMPRRGLLVDSVIKSGGNDFHGTAVAYGSGEKLEGDNIDDDPRCGGHQERRLCTRCRTSPAPWAAGSSGTSSGFSAAPGIRTSRATSWMRSIPTARRSRMSSEGTYHFEKISYQASAGNRFTGFYHVNNDMELRDATKFIPRESMLDKDNPTWMTKAEWQAVRGNSLVTSVQVGQWDFNGDNYNGISPGKQSTTDIATLYVTGNHVHPGPQPQWAATDRGRRHTKGVVSWYKPDLAGGNHEFKAGVDHLWTWDRRQVRDPGSRARRTSCGSTTACPSRSPRRTRRLKGQNHGQLSWRVWAGLVDLLAPADAQPGDARRARHRVCAGAMSRGLTLCRGPVL